MSRLRLILGGGLVLVFALLVGALFRYLDRPVEVAPPPPVARTPAPASEPVVVAEAPEPVDEAPAVWPADAPRILRGRVHDPADAPIAGATLRVEVGTAVVARARTGADGTYTLRDVPARPDRIRVQAAGFGPYADERPAFPAGRDVPYDVTLTPVPGLRGLVLAEERPVSGAQVMLHGIVRRPLAFARTDEEGRFFLPWIEGATAVAAQQGQYGSVREPVSGPGDVVLRLPSGGFIAGRVVDEAGRPVEDFSVSASPLTWGRGGPPAQSFSSDDGHFLLGPLAAGRMEIWAAAEGYQPAERRGVEVRAGETVEGVTLTLRTSVVLEGQVTDARTGRPVEGAQVVPAEWRSGALAEAVGTYTDADGRYRLDALPGVRTSIRVKAEGYRSVLIGGVEGAPGSRVVRDFALNPQPDDAMPGSELTGVGAVLAGHPEGVRIGQILPGGPAEGVLAAGDVVVSVDGAPIQGSEMSKVAQAIRGEEGSEVELMVRRGGEGPPERVVLVRGRVTVPDRHHMPRN